MGKKNDRDAIIIRLFDGTEVVATHDVATAYDLSENTVRAYAEDLEVARIGASFAWVQSDVEALEEQLDADNLGDDEDEDDGGEDE